MQQDPLDEVDACFLAVARSEVGRLAALEALRVLGTPPEAAFDDLVRRAARMLEAPMASVSLIDAERQWSKAAVNMDHATVPRAHAFCDWTIRSPGAFVVLDALDDPRFARNPLVTALPGIRFYAGVPLRLTSGYKVGALCVLDTVPRTNFGTDARLALSALAEEAMAALETRGDHHGGDVSGSEPV